MRCCKIDINTRYSVFLSIDYAIYSAYNYFCNIKTRYYEKDSLL